MAFWGVELRPGTPYTHRYNPSDGCLRVTQAALIRCDGATRTMVRCTLGNRMPLILCSLNPGLCESCHLEVEFEENVDVLFSVVGPSSVHLSGYYIRNSTSNHNIARDQQPPESSGEDIGIESDNEYLYVSEEEIYESDFINDGHSEASDKHIDENPTRKCNRNSISYSSSEDSSDDEDSLRSEKVESLRMWSFLSNDETEKENNDARKRKCDAINHDPTARTELTDVNGSSIYEPELGKQKKSKKTPLEKEDGKHSNNIRTLEDGLIIEDLSAGNRNAKAAKGNKVYINYVGKLQDGKIVHSNAGKNPYKFKLGAEKVIRGWDLGIIGMVVGGKRRLTIPPSLCRIGDESVGESSTTIIYEVELVKV